MTCRDMPNYRFVFVKLESSGLFKIYYLKKELFLKYAKTG